MGERTLAQKMAAVKDILGGTYRSAGVDGWYMLHTAGTTLHKPCTFERCDWGEENARYPCPIVVYGQMLDEAIERAS